MATVSLNVVQIRECLKKLVKRAKVNIPELPREALDVEHYFVVESFEKDGEEYDFALDFSPPVMGERSKSMMLCCVVNSLSKGVKMDRPVLLEPVDKLIQIIDSEEVFNKCLIHFISLFDDIEDYDPEDRYDFD